MNRTSPAASTESASAQERRIAFESLRERTDELELIISGISLLALLALPGWLFDQWVRLELHAEGQRHLLLSLGFQLASGLSMTMAGAFLLHLAVRAYWVGLIGLKAAFPAGIRWDAIRSIGPITRDYHRRTVVDLDSAIDAADRAASIVFALVSLVALSVFWIGGLLALMTLLAIGVSTLFGAPLEPSAKVGAMAFGVLFVFIVLPQLLLDNAWLSRRLQQPAPDWRRRFVELLVRLQSVVIPQRLVLPVQLSLESNLPRWIFTLMFLLLVGGSALLGRAQETAAREFALVSSYAYFGDADADEGLRSAHYENLRGTHDALARVPLIPADMIADGHLRLFLPYLPDRDNASLRARCGPAEGQAQRRACLAGLWQVEIDAKPVDLGDFLPAERRDLGQRGLQGYLSLAGFAPGRHELRVRWNGEPAPAAGSGAKTPGYRIPFWFSPPYQQDLAPAAP
ncbi:hypothetical protein [Tahibacter caeni]|uniref:hypothetical protein n=1 Tax=Tahibacter caeni TaxID=1453545 RepID=UPI002149493A|nr:hypothetical protein [Tahibacter caeni]